VEAVTDARLSDYERAAQVARKGTQRNVYLSDIILALVAEVREYKRAEQDAAAAIRRTLKGA
jgi:hypothetical protein